MTLISTSAVVSILRFRIPFRFRLITFMLIISTAVIAGEQLLRAFFPEVAKDLGPYVGLIVTNCIILGRLESFASGNSLKDSIIDGVGVSLGYSTVLMSMALIREFLGNGTLWGLKAAWSGFVPCRLFSSPTGAFLVFAGLIALVNWLKPLARREK
jgi:Na+-transporting NADH:ubiquinone oxidoreductase subunit NqrD